MSDDLVAKYRESLKQRREAEEAVQRLAGTIAHTTLGLRDPLRFKVSKAGVGFHAIEDGGYNLNAEDWPTAERIAKAVSALQERDSATTDAWDGIPTGERHGLAPPVPITLSIPHW